MDESHKESHELNIRSMALNMAVHTHGNAAVNAEYVVKDAEKYYTFLTKKPEATQ